MSHLVQTADAFGTAAVPVALAAAYANGSTIQPWRPANTLRLSCTLAWVVAPTNARVRIAWSVDGGTTWVPVSVVNSVAAGVVSLADGTFDLPLGTAGTHEVVVGIPAGADLRVSAAMVDAGGSNPTLYARAVLTDE